MEIDKIYNMETILHNDDNKAFVEAVCKLLKASAMNARMRNFDLEKAIKFIENQRNKKKILHHKNK